MAAVFALVSKNQTLRLVLESLIFASALFWFRSVHGFWSPLFLIAVFLYSYFRPFTQSGRFLTASLAVIVSPFILPPLGSLEAYFAVFIGFLLGLILGIKGLVFVKRKLWLQILYFLISGATTYFYFLEPTTKNQVMVFIFFALLFREAHSFLTENREVKNFLIGLIYALLFVEISWAISLLPLSRLAATIFVVVVLLTTHDVIMNSESNKLSKIVVRDSVLFVLLLMVLFVFSRWSLT